jgi:hypothetical protein
MFDFLLPAAVNSGIAISLDSKYFQVKTWLVQIIQDGGKRSYSIRGVGPSVGQIS